MSATPAMHPTGQFPADIKTELRQKAIVAREGLTVGARDRAAEKLRKMIETVLQPAAGSVIAGYWPVRGEIDVLPCLRSWIDRGGVAALPAIVGRDMPLAFRAWTPDTVMVQSRIGIAEPDPARAKAVIPDILLVPVVAFDRQRRRLGYGGGFYDRTIARLRDIGALQVAGVAYASQEVADIPREAHDEIMDMIITDSGVVK